MNQEVSTSTGSRLSLADISKLLLLIVLTTGVLSTKWVRIGPATDPLVDPSIDPDNLQGLRFVALCMQLMPSASLPFTHKYIGIMHTATMNWCKYKHNDS